MIEVFADLTCPFTYVGLTRILAYRDALDRDDPIRVKAWPLELVNGEPLAPALLASEISELRRTVAPDLFGGFDPAHLPRSTLAPLALVARAYRHDVRAGERVSMGLRKKLFEDGLDISAPDLLTAVGAQYGVPEGPLDTALVAAEWHEGQRLGVEGSPHFFVDGTGFFCPSLRISHEGEHLRVRPDENGFAAFVDAAFPEPAVQ
jgi:predicted DsbA family dithiol-disulfide isomerase